MPMDDELNNDNLPPEIVSSVDEYYAKKANEAYFVTDFAAQQAERGTSYRAKKNAPKYRAAATRALLKAVESNITADKSLRKTPKYKEQARKAGMTFYPPKGEK